MTSTDPHPNPAMAVAAPGTYRADPSRSSVTFTTRHMFGLGGVSGSFQVRSGSVIITDPPERSSARGEVDTASFHTGLAARDKQVRSKAFLDAVNFPVITFRSTGLRRGETAWVLSGQLTVRGNQAPAEFTVTEAATRDGELVVSAEATVDRYQHGITAMKGMAGRRLRISLTVTAVPA